LFQLIEQGLIDGLRIDHVDGLANPRAYCRRLRRRIDRLRPDRHLPIYVEKILGADESLPGDWGVDGTTGYEFMNQVSLLQHDPDGEAPLTLFWKTTTGRNLDFEQESVQARQLMLQSRSEEHTSELQSRENLVWRLLLDKKYTSSWT